MIKSFDLVIWIGSLYECKEYKENQTKFANPAKIKMTYKKANS